MSDHPPSVLTRQVTALQAQHPTDRIVLLAPRLQLGAALKQAATETCRKTAGLTATTPARYAESLVGLSLRSNGHSPLQAGQQFFLTAATLETLDPDRRSALTADRPLSGVLRPLMRTFDTLRLHGVTPAAYEQHAARSPRQRAQAQAYATYERLLDRHSLYDTAALFETATEQLHTGGFDHSSTVFAILDTVELPTTAATFVEALPVVENGSTPRLYRVGAHASPDQTNEPSSLPPPTPRAAAHFPDVPYPPSVSAAPSPAGRAALYPDATLSADEADSLSFWTATGVRREVQAVLEDIVANGHPLDTVEIAFTSQEPYLSLLDVMAERYDLPLSISTGRNIDATRPGQALRGFFEWIADGFSAPDLIHLLRSGLIQFDAPIGEDGAFGRLTGSHAATLLAQKRYPEGAHGYTAVFESWIDEITAELESLRAVESDPDWLDDTRRDQQQKKAAVEALKSEVEELLEVARANGRWEKSTVRPSDFAEGAAHFLKRFGPTPKPTGPKDERTPDEAARNRLLDRLQLVAQTDDLSPQSLRSLARQMTTWLELSPFVRAQRPRPGRAHVVPLESAGYANRDHLYVIGLDAASSSTVLTDDPMLTDEERTELANVSPHLPLRKARADTDAWLAARALARHEGPVTLCASTHDLMENEDLFEAPLYLRLREAASGAEESERPSSVTHHSLATDTSTALAPLDCWTSRRDPTPSVVTEVLTSTYPWVHEGLEAEAERASTRYTAYDGLLAPDSYPELNPLHRAGPLSAGQLETYARAPYAYFLKYVLDVEPLDEPALDDHAWLDALDRGAVLHDTFKRFMADLNRQPTLDDEPTLRSVFDTVLKEKRDELPPPSEVVYAATKRQLWQDADLFLHAEANRSDAHQPHRFEVGFGYPPHRRQDGDHPNAPTLDLGESSFALRGRIDRIDRHADETVSLWDYKTGSSGRFEDGDLLDGGRHLQWALYAYAYEALEDLSVREAGYFFTSTDEMGKRLSANPATHRADVAAAIKQIADGIAAGAFPVTDAKSLKYSFNALFHDFRARTSQLTDKEWGESRPAPPPLIED